MSNLLVVALDDTARKHVAEALRRYAIDLRRDYQPCPAQIADLQAFLSASLTGQQEPASVDVTDCFPKDDDMLTREGAARYLKISVAHLDRLVAAGRIPSQRLGRRRLFSRIELKGLKNEPVQG